MKRNPLDKPFLKNLITTLKYSEQLEVSIPKFFNNDGEPCLEVNMKIDGDMFYFTDMWVSSDVLKDYILLMTGMKMIVRNTSLFLHYCDLLDNCSDDEEFVEAKPQVIEDTEEIADTEVYKPIVDAEEIEDAEIEEDAKDEEFEYQPTQLLDSISLEEFSLE